MYGSARVSLARLLEGTKLCGRPGSDPASTTETVNGPRFLALPSPSGIRNFGSAVVSSIKAGGLQADPI
jgi:hypothetical protein